MDKNNQSCIHRIGGINFLTVTDIDFPDLHEQGINKYLAFSDRPDIKHNIQRININPSTTSMLPPEMRNRIRKCLVISEINDESQVLIPFMANGREDSYFLLKNGVVDDLDVPLFRSRELMARLNTCLDHSDQVVLIVHLLFVEIRDFFSHQLDIFYVDELAPDIENYSTKKYIERMFRIFLPDFNAMLIHSSTVNRNGKAAIFLAQGGGGKTTTARQAPIDSVLGDDQIILRNENGKYMAHSTPWGRIVNCPEAVQLGGFFLIEKARQFELIR
jgi:hypothetical protein